MSIDTNTLRYVAGSNQFRYIVERRHLCDSADEIEQLRQRLAAAEAAARWLWWHATCGIHHPQEKQQAVERWPWLEEQIGGIDA